MQTIHKGKGGYTAVARFKVSLGKLPRESNIRQSDLQAVKLTAKKYRYRYQAQNKYDTIRYEYMSRICGTVPEKFPDQASAAGPNGNLPSTSFDVPRVGSGRVLGRVRVNSANTQLIAFNQPAQTRPVTRRVTGTRRVDPTHLDPEVCPPLSSTHRDRLYASPSSWPTYPRSDSQAPTTASYSQFARSPSARPTSPSQHRNASEPIISDPTTLVKATDIIVAISKHVSVSVSVTHAHLINRAILSPVAGSPAHLPPSKITT
ncbi:hypothetical protein PGTUg99_030968 [Puccinia graminis f. sp. tritici]|uniref:Uncharacterized protein n=1 Tax=Puccinia graminis f. sp. tritici TaxID=56615 RepID=A0A5B0SF73_PUCGR|nr:hypothetical protein PGTUg99_030968 [Puccinia graminis f. sp. tritici]